jgi:hydroxyacylglutathione hydrolase
MTQITDGLRYIQGQDELLPDSHTYVLGNPFSRDLSLVDVGMVGKGGYKVQSVLKMGIDLKAIKRVILTHTHLDHIGCLPEIRRQMPWVEVWIHTLEADPLEQGDERTVYGMDMFREMAEMQYGLKPGAFSFRADRKLQGGESLDLGGMTWEILHIPGHSMGSVALYHAPEKILIPGDVIYADSAIGRFDLHGADGPQLKKSLMKLAEKDVAILLPGHNRIVRKVPAAYMGNTVKQWEAYLT